MAKTIDPVAVLREKQDGKSMREVSRELGVSVTYISDVLAGRRAAGPKLLKGLGLVRHEVIRRG